ncbi:MAG: tetratricopeptide repeat protein, partial [Myxococcales bacterium]|nr:tetratricopeptide repeat protein [Myxococcales bacterium]
EPGLAAARDGLAEVLARARGGEREAEALYREAIELDPWCASSWAGLGVLLDDERGREAEAKAALDEAVRLYSERAARDPSDAWPCEKLGALYMKLERDEEAEAAFREALARDPNHAWTWSELGDLLLDELKRAADAEVAYRNAIACDPRRAWDHNRLGEILREDRQRLDEAEAAFRAATERRPEAGFMWADLGDFLWDRRQRYADAADAFREAVGRDATLARAWRRLARLLHEFLDEHEEAEWAYRNAIETGRGTAPARGMLAKLLREQLGRSEEADALYRELAEEDDCYRGFSGNTVAFSLVEGKNPAHRGWDPYLELSPGFAALDVQLLDGPVLEDVDYITDRSGPHPMGANRYLSLVNVLSAETLARYRARVVALLGRLLDDDDAWVVFLGQGLDRDDDDLMYISHFIGAVTSHDLELNGRFSILELQPHNLSRAGAWLGVYDGVSGLLAREGDFKRVLGRLPMDDAIPTGRRWCEKSPFPQPESAALLESVLGVGRLWFEELDNGTRLRFTGATEAIASLRARLTSILPELNAGPD